jgi:hypothetical protein
MHPAKWPQLLIVMETDVPKGPTGKAQRINFSKRANLDTLSDNTPAWSRYPLYFIERALYPSRFASLCFTHFLLLFLLDIAGCCKQNAHSGET